MPDLSSQQKSATQYINGPLLVLAGAGSGKTSLLVHKIAWLIREYAVPPPAIVALAPTAAAAQSMRARLADLLPGRPTHEVFISTFNGYGLEILHRHGHALGYRPGFSVYGPEDSQALLARLVRDQFNDATVSAQAVQACIAQWKRSGEKPRVRAEQGKSRETVAAHLYAHYEESLQTANAVDVEDLLLKPARLLLEGGEAAGRLLSWTRYLLVDEYEETTRMQHELVRRLAQGGALLTAAGDDDQSIRGSAGAQPGNLERLRKDLPNLRTVRLEQNFRSTGRILKAASSLNAHSPHHFDKTLWSEAPYGEPIRIYRAHSEEHEGERIVSALLEHKFRRGSEFRHYAILLRRAEQSGPIERALRERRVPYYLAGRPSLFQRTEVRDLLTCLRLLVNPSDDAAFMRVLNTPRRDLDRSALVSLERYACEQRMTLLQAALDPELARRITPGRLENLHAFAEWIQALIQRSATADAVILLEEILTGLRYEEWLRDSCNDRKIAEERMENVLTLLHLVQRLVRQQPESGLQRQVEELRRLALMGTDPDEHPGDAVSLLTLDKAKGVEYDYVFIAGLEEGLLPYGGETDAAHIEAERRLLYVGMTRARETLALSFAERRRRGGEVAVRTASRFLSELPAADLEWPASDRAPTAELALRDSLRPPGPIRRHS